MLAELAGRPPLLWPNLARFEAEQDGYEIVHHDLQRDLYTLERRRRWFKGRYVVMTAEELVNGR